jgi:hypothetical protein
MKNLSNSVFIRKVFAILTSSILINFTFKKKLSHSLEILSHEYYQEEIDASYIIPLLRKMHYMEAIKELGERLKCTSRRIPKMKRVDYYLEHPRNFSWTSI